MTKKFPVELRDRVVRTTLDRLSEYPSVFTACEALAPNVKVGVETLCNLVPQAQIDAETKMGPKSVEFEEIRKLKCVNRALREDQEILNEASSFVALPCRRNKWKRRACRNGPSMMPSRSCVACGNAILGAETRGALLTSEDDRLDE